MISKKGKLAIATGLALTAGLSALFSRENPKPSTLENSVVETNDNNSAMPVINDPLNYQAVEIPKVEYAGFPYRNEINEIKTHANRLGIEPELIMAIRLAENGKSGREYGVIPMGKSKERYDRDTGYALGQEFVAYTSEREKQLAWSARTVHNKLESYKENPEGHSDFISYLASKYAPIGVSNDPKGLNKNWEKNVRNFYKELKKE